MKITPNATPEALLERAQTQPKAPALHRAAPADPSLPSKPDPRIERAFGREAVDPQSRARRPGLGKVIDILV